LSPILPMNIIPSGKKNSVRVNLLFHSFRKPILESISAVVPSSVFLLFLVSGIRLFWSGFFANLFFRFWPIGIINLTYISFSRCHSDLEFWGSDVFYTIQMRCWLECEWVKLREGRRNCELWDLLFILVFPFEFPIKTPDRIRYEFL